MSIRKRLLAVLLLAVPTGMQGATVLYLNSSTSSLTVDGDDAVARNLKTSRGSALASFVKDTQAGPVTPPTTGTQWTINSASDQKISWLSDPVASTTFLSGIATINAWAKDNSTAANVAITGEILRVDSSGVILGTVVSCLLNRIELGQTASPQNWTKTMTNTTLEVGDRLAVRFYVSDASGFTMAAGYLATIYFNTQNPGTSGDSFISLPQTISFQAATPTITATLTNSPTPVNTSTLTFTLTPSETLTQTPSSHTYTLTPPTQSLLFMPVSTQAPQTVLTPSIGYGIQVIRVENSRSSSSGTEYEIYGGGATVISVNPKQAIVGVIGNGLPIGTSGNFMTLPLGSPLTLRERTPVAVASAGGVTYPYIIFNYKEIFIGSATATFTVTATPTFTPVP